MMKITNNTDDIMKLKIDEFSSPIQSEVSTIHVVSYIVMINKQ